MAEIKDIIAQILKCHATGQSVSNAQLTKLVFLSDWHQAIECRKQISNIDWYFNNYGPFVWDIRDEALKYPEIFKITDTSNDSGQRRISISLIDESYEPNISEDQKRSIQHAVLATQNLDWDEFRKLIYSTYPIMSSERYKKINLVEKAREYATSVYRAQFGESGG